VKGKVQPSAASLQGKTWVVYKLRTMSKKVNEKWRMKSEKRHGA